MKKVIDIYLKVGYIGVIKSSCMGKKKNPRGKVSSPLSECLAVKPVKKSNKSKTTSKGESKMESIKYITIGIVASCVISLAILFGIDREVARRDYNENVEQCKNIDGCLFDMNCNKYNEMIWEACND